MKYLLAAISFLLVSCNEPERFTGSTMGTTWSLVIDSEIDHSSEIQSRLDELEVIFSHWKDDSELSQINTQWKDSTAPALLSADLAAVITSSLALSELTNGAFNIAHGTEPNPPPAHFLLSTDGNRLIPTRRGVALDLSAIAKGYAVDQIAELLEAHGHQSYLIEIGGELRSLGKRNQNDPWKVGIKAPSPGKLIMSQKIDLPTTTTALATSGNYEQVYSIKPGTGVIDSHITSENQNTHFRSVSVLHTNAMLADAWATALFAMPLNKAKATARLNDLRVLWLTQMKDGTVESHEINFTNP